MISSHRVIKDEEGRCIAAVKALELIEKKSQDLIVELAEIDWDKKSAEATLDVVERQTEAQHKQLRQVEDELVAARGQIKTLTKKLEKAEKAKEQAEQEGYDVGVVETEEALRAEVSEVCRFYCLQVWNEALDRAGVEAYFALRKAENVYYPQTIRSLGSLGSSSSKADLVSSGTNEGKESPTRALPTANISSKEAKLSEDAKKAANFTKEVARDAALPSSMEIVLATLPIPSKEELQGKGQASTKAATTQSPKKPKDKLVIKMKQLVVPPPPFFLFWFPSSIIRSTFVIYLAFSEA